ncbi:MAG: hypothetical protein RIF41_10630 [Polyangiaceae bacterium]
MDGIRARTASRGASSPAASWAALVGVLAVVYAPVFFGRVAFHRDIARWVYPARWFARATFWADESAAWNPFVSLGFTTAADPLYGLHYPPNWLTLVGPLPAMCSWLWLLHLVAGAGGVAVLARRFGLPHHAAAVGGLAWSLSGFVGSTWTTGVLLPAAALMPWVTVAMVDVVRAKDRRALVGGVAEVAVAVGAQLLLGEVFLCAMGVGLGCAVAGIWWWAHPTERGAGAATVGVLPLGVAIGALVGGISLIPAYIAASTTTRAEALPREVAEGWSVHPARLVELLASGALGRAWEAHGSSSGWAREWLGGNPLSLDFYLGGSVLALVALALLDRDRRRRRLAAAVAATGLLALLIAMGKHLPLHHAVRTVVPPLARMRAPEKYLAVVVPCVALLAAMGAARVRSDDDEDAGGRWIGPAVVAVLALAVLVSAGMMPSEVTPFARQGALQGMLGAVAVAVVVHQRRRLRAAAPWLVILIVALDLGATTKRIVRFGDPALLDGTAVVAQAIRSDASDPALDRPPPRLYRSKQVSASTRGSGLPTEARTLATLRENVSVPKGVAVVPGYEAAAPPTVAAMMALKQRAVLRLLGVDHALLPAPIDGPPRAREGFEPMASPVPGAELYRVEHVLPRAYVASAARLVGEDIAPEQLLAEEVVTGRRVWVEATADEAIRAAVADVEGRCTITSFHTDSLTARCEARGPALAVFVEQMAPGWTATVDGAPAPIAVGNGAVRVVPIGAGQSEVHLSFETPGGRLGMAASGFGVLLALAALGWSRVKRS